MAKRYAYDKKGGRHTFDPFNAGLSSADYQAWMKNKGYSVVKPSSTTKKSSDSGTTTKTTGKWTAYDSKGNKHTLSKGFAKSYFDNWMKKRNYTADKPVETKPKGEKDDVHTLTAEQYASNPYLQKPGEEILDYTKRINEMNAGDTTTGDGDTTTPGDTGDTGDTGDGDTGDGETGDGETGDGDTGDKGDTGDTTNYLDSLPDEIKNDPAFQGMSDDMQEAIAYNNYIQSQGAEEDIQSWNDALAEARESADPYFNNLLMVAIDEVNRASTKLTGDYASRAQQLQDNLANIQEDLTTNRAYLSLSEQAELTKLSQQYQVELENTQQTMAAKGLTFSTNRSTTEGRLEQSQQGLVESTTRQYGYQMQRLEQEAARGNTAAQTQLDDLKRQLGYDITSIGRGFEQQWGSSSLPQLEGYSPLGGIVGTMAEERTKDIASRREAIYDDATRASLSSIYNY